MQITDFLPRKDRTGNRKTREQRKQFKVPELGYYLIVTDTEATERCFFTGLHQAFDKLYDRFMDMEKKTFMKNFLEDVNFYDEEQDDGRILKSLKFRFPVFFNNQEVYKLDWDNESIVETVALLSK